MLVATNGLQPDTGDVNPQVDQQKKGRLWPRTLLLLKQLILTVTVLIILAVGLEIGTRLLTDITPPLFRNDPILGKTYRPGFHDEVFASESGQNVDMRFNRSGMRGGDIPYVKLPGVRRIAVIGDSFTAAMAVCESDTAVHVLQEMLTKTHPETRWEVMNCGISGSSTGQELVLYQEVVRKYQPDIVICAFCVWNDFGDNCRRLTSSPHRIYFDLDAQRELYRLPMSASRSQLSAWLNANSRFYVWQKRATNIVKTKVEKKMRAQSKCKLIYCAEIDEQLEHAWALTERLIEEFKEDVEKDGAEFVLAILPAAEQVYEESWQQVVQLAGERASHFDKDYPRRRLKELADRIGLQIIDLQLPFRQATPNHSIEHREEWLYFGGRGHLNVAGNRLFAQHMHRFLTAARPVLTQEKPRPNVNR